VIASRRHRKKRTRLLRKNK